MDGRERSYAVCKRGSADTLREVIDLELYVLINAEQDHVVNSGTQDDDGKSLVHAGPGHCLGGRGDLLGLAKKDTLGTSFAGVEGISLWHIVSFWCYILLDYWIPYAEPRKSAADSAGDRGRSERRLALAELSDDDLLDSLVDAEVEARPDGITHAMKTEASV